MSFYIEQVFVQSDVKEDVYMRLLKGCGRFSGNIVRLNKSLYGLKQASRQWHARITECLLTLGCVQYKANACVSFDRGGERGDDYTGSYVDDIFAVGKRERCDLFGRA